MRFTSKFLVAVSEKWRDLLADHVCWILHSQKGLITGYGTNTHDDLLIEAGIWNNPLFGHEQDVFLDSGYAWIQGKTLWITHYDKTPPPANVEKELRRRYKIPREFKTKYKWRMRGLL
jgi:hypothetical protein